MAFTILSFSVDLLSKTNNTYNILDYVNFAHKKDTLVCRDVRDDINLSSLNILSIKTSIDNGHIGLQRFRSLEQVDGIFVSLLLCFMLLVNIYRKGLFFFKENINVAFFSQTTNSFTESTISEFWYNLLLFFQAIFLFSLILFVYFFETKNITLYPDNPFLTILSLSLLFLIFEGLKYLLYYCIGYVFDSQKLVFSWIRVYSVVIQMMGILSFIPVLLLIYFDYYHDVLFVFFISLFILSRIIIIYRLGIFFLQKNVNFLYLIAYLCSIEIIPYILLYRGMVYLYENEIINFIWL